MVPAGFACLLAAAEPARFAYHLPPDIYRKAAGYSQANYLLYFAGAALQMLVLVAIIGLRIAPRLRDRVRTLPLGHWLQAPAFFVPLLAVPVLFNLPFQIYGHHLDVLYGQSIQSWASFLDGWAKGRAFSVALSAIAAWIVYAYIGRAHRYWWLWCWLLSVPCIVTALYLEPLAISPVFDNFRPLAERHPGLAGKLHLLSVRAGAPIPTSRIYEKIVSRKSPALNAYVSGLGSSRQIVVYDTMVSREQGDQILSTFAHELGHHVLGHVWKSTAAALALLLILFFVCSRILKWIFPPGGRWGVRDLGDWASFPVVLLLLAVIGFLFDPVENAFSRRQEAAADLYALQLTTGVVADPGATAAASLQLEGETNLADPDPPAFIRFWLYSHPPLAERIRVAAGYRASAPAGR